LRFWDISNCFEIGFSDLSGGAEEYSDALSTDIAKYSITATGHNNRVLCLKIVSAPGQLPVVVSGSADNTIRVWAIVDPSEDEEKIFRQQIHKGITPPELQCQYELRDKKNVTWFICLDYFVHDKKAYIVSGCKDNTVKVWALKRPEPRAETGAEDYDRYAYAPSSSSSSSSSSRSSRRRRRKSKTN
jgi:WD40 repeat protein